MGSKLPDPLRIGSRLSLTGVYVSQGASRLAGDNVAPFDLLLRSPLDINVLALPSWWTLQRLLMGMGMLASSAGGHGFLWITQLHRQVDRRTQVELKVKSRNANRSKTSAGDGAGTRPHRPRFAR